MPTKNKRVTRKFLLNLANDIYNPKTRKFLRLCDGKLQNGPDPTNKKRPMHCGLGELYFAITGKQPETDRVDENDVIDLTVELSLLNGNHDETLATFRKGVKELGLPEEIQDRFLVEVDGLDFSHHDNDDREEDVSQEGKFRTALNEIPGGNDDKCGDACTFEVFRARSKRVAAQLRAAAKLLPR